MAEATAQTPAAQEQTGVQVPGTIPQSPQGAVNPTTGAGQPGGQGLEEGLIQTELPEFFTTEWDRDVVRMGWASTPINAMTRSVGFKITKSMEFGYWTIGMRQSVGQLNLDANLAFSALDNKEDLIDTDSPAEYTLKVKNGVIFDVTDQIVFKGVDGACKKEARKTETVIKPLMPLAARVTATNTKTKDAHTITVQFLNAKASVVIPKDCEVMILGHALTETDATVTPHAANPVETKQFMQKFMTTALVSNVYLEARKAADWGLKDIVEMNNQQFVEDIEKTYIFGVRSYTVDPQTNRATRTCAGIIQQMLEGGAHIVRMKKSTLSDETLIGSMSEIFTGNTGSTQRYMYTGMEFATSLFSLKGIQRQVNANETVRKFEYDFTKIKLFNFSLLNAPHPLLDKFGYSNWALVLDRQYVERRVFRAMIEDQHDLMKIGIYDGKDVRCCEISSILLKYPQCHALIIIEDDLAAAA